MVYTSFAQKRVERKLEKAMPTQPITALHKAVPVSSVTTDDNYHTITLHSHKIIIERQSPLYRAIAALEGLLLVASSLFLISLSGLTIVYAYTMLS